MKYQGWKMEDRVINIIEDHESIVQCLDHIVCALENGGRLPNYLPVLHDALVSDLLGKICGALERARVAGVHDEEDDGAAISSQHTGREEDIADEARCTVDDFFNGYRNTSLDIEGWWE